ncbi:bifunctional glutamate N-acetyltransferase/amino-acid acetyltransferase ArgJ [soil metagenome]
MTELPAGFIAHIANVGVKDETDDLVVITAAAPVPAAGVFTRSRFVGPSVTISRDHLVDGMAQAIVIVSKNANVANGPAGRADAEAVVGAVADRLGCRPDEVLIASTGVIGRRYPLARILAGVGAMPAHLTGTSAEAAARGIMTTDTVAKVASETVGDGPARVVGVAKGVGMLEQDMATLIVVVLTDAAVESAELDRRFRGVIDRTLNCVSIDTDTSTSDTAVVLASGAAGPVDGDDLERAIGAVAESLTKQIARDGEGAEKLIEVVVDGARDSGQAKRVAKAIVNSPLVKTAVHGADPNWGRVAMAIGKCQDDVDIDQERVVIRFGHRELYPTPIGEAELAELSAYLTGDEVRIHVTLGTGDAACTVWGCDLTAGYVRLNADYTT